MCLITDKFCSVFMIKAKKSVWIAAARLIAFVMTKEGMDLSVSYIISLKALHIQPVTI